MNNLELLIDRFTSRPYNLLQRGSQGGARAARPTGRRVPRHAPVQRPHDQYGHFVDRHARGHIAGRNSRFKVVVHFPSELTVTTNVYLL